MRCALVAYSKISNASPEIKFVGCSCTCGDLSMTRYLVPLKNVGTSQLTWAI